jgi:hypothetical protein
MQQLSRWHALHDAIEEERAQSSRGTGLDLHIEALRTCLRGLAADGRCSPLAPWRLEKLRTPAGEEACLRQGEDAWAGKHPAIRLRHLTHLQDGALLTISMFLSRMDGILHYSVGLQGTTRGTQHLWYVRIDLGRQGEAGRGPCCHPVLHCHVGTRPDEKGEPPVRVPLPWLTPREAMEWVLATVEPALEPALHEVRDDG